MYARVENDIIAYLISDEEYETIGNKEDFAHINANAEIPEVLETVNGIPKYLYDNGDFKLRSDLDISDATLENQKQMIRRQRQQEFALYLDRSPLFYSELTEEQLTELKAWREAWKNAPETLEIPTRPDWLK